MVRFSVPILLLLILSSWNFITCCSLRQIIHRKKQPFFFFLKFTVYVHTALPSLTSKFYFHASFFILISHSKTLWGRMKTSVCLLLMIKNLIIRSWVCVLSSMFSCWYSALFSITTLSSFYRLLFFTKRTAKALRYIKA